MNPLPYLNFNGSMLPLDHIPRAQNPRHRPQKGVFETMRWEKHRLPFLDAHLQRLNRGLKRLQLKAAFPKKAADIHQEVHALLARGGDPSYARVRLHVFLSDPESSTLDYTLEAWALTEQEQGWNEKGYKLGWGEADGDPQLSEFKVTPNAQWDALETQGREQGWDDMIRLRDGKWMIETMRANLFIIENEKIYTPPLSEGCVDGVMRQWLISTLGDAGIPIFSLPLSTHRLAKADGVFLTNAVRRIQWVSQIKSYYFPPDPVRALYLRAFGQS